MVLLLSSFPSTIQKHSEQTCAPILCLVKCSQIPQGISNGKLIFNRMNLPQDTYYRMNPAALQTTFGMMRLLKHLCSVPFHTLYSLPCTMQPLLWKITSVPLVWSHIHQICIDILASLESLMALNTYYQGHELWLCIVQGLDSVCPGYPSWPSAAN